MTEEADVQDFRIALAQQVVCCGRENPFPCSTGKGTPWITSLVLVQVFLYKAADSLGTDKAKLQNEILETVFQQGLAPYYEHICSDLGWQVDQAKLLEMQDRKKQQLEKLELKISDAAVFLGNIGDREAATAAFKVTEDKTASGASKADMVFSQIRLAIMYQDWHEVKKLLAHGKTICEAGGDWEHKNKLKLLVLG
eukprot:gene3394-3668_t